MWRMSITTTLGIQRQLTWDGMGTRYQLFPLPPFLNVPPPPPPPPPVSTSTILLCPIRFSRCTYNNRSLRILPAAAADSKSTGDNEEQASKENGNNDGERGSSSRTARLSARRQESIKLLPGSSSSSISDFLSHPAGMESLLNKKALQKLVPLDAAADTFRCTLHHIQLLNFQFTPVLDLRVTSTHTHCTVELLSCRFEGSESILEQSDLFSAFMRNYITWETSGDELCLNIDVNLEVTIEVYTIPFSLLPLSAVETPGNLLMQGLLDRLVPLLGEQLVRDYRAWVEERSEVSP